MSEAKIHFSIESRLDQVRLLRAAVRAIADELGCDESTCFQIQLGLTEAVNNVIEHAYHFQPDCRVNVDIETALGFIELQITDNGVPFPLECEAKLLDADAHFPDPLDGEHGERGRGLGIIHQTMDSVKFDRSEGKNHLLMRKNYLLV